QLKATCFLPDCPPDPQMIARIVLDQEEQLHILSTENARQRETIALLTEKRQRTTRRLKQLRQRIDELRETLDNTGDYITELQAQCQEQPHNEAQQKIERLE